MAKLEIGDWNYEDMRLEFPINDWLAKTNRLNILAGAIAHPKSGGSDEDGMLLMTHFAVCDSEITLEERAQDMAVKAWLIQEGGIREDDLEWISLRDRFSLTRCGVVPLRNNPKKIRHIKVPPDQVGRWSDYVSSGQGHMTLGQFVEMEAAEAARK